MKEYNQFLGVFLRKYILYFLILWGAIARAEQAPVLSEADLDSDEETLEQSLIRGNIAISNWFDGIAENIDLYLAGKRMTKRKNTTSVRIENRTSSSEGKAVTNDIGLNINLRLPNVEEYWQLKFTTYDEMSEKRGGVQRAVVRPVPRERNYGATIGVFRKLGNIRTAFQPRVELQDPLRVSHSLSFASVADMKKYQITPKLELYAVAEKGTGIFWSLNFDFELNPKQTLTFINDADYVDRQHMESVTNGASLSESLTDKASLAYSLLFFSNNRPSYHLEGYSIVIGWSELIYKNILDYQLTPHLDFNKTDSFRGRAGVSLNVNLNF